MLLDFILDNKKSIEIINRQIRELRDKREKLIESEANEIEITLIRHMIESAGYEILGAIGLSYHRVRLFPRHLFKLENKTAIMRKLGRIEYLEIDLVTIKDNLLIEARLSSDLSDEQVEWLENTYLS